jgi:hypothetical protein
MARKQKWMVTSDLSGEDVPEELAVEVVLTYHDGSTRTLDVAESEIPQFQDKGKFRKRRGRQPGTKNKSKEG